MPKKRIFFYSGTILIILFILAFLQHILQRPYINYYYQRSMSNLRDIGLALLIYAEEHNDILPDNLEQLYTYLNIKYEDVFVSPCKPADFDGPSYIYISGHPFQDIKSKEKYIVVYENPKYLTGYEMEKINVLYLDAHVERLEKEDFISKLEVTYEHLGKEMPKIKFKD